MKRILATIIQHYCPNSHTPTSGSVRHSHPGPRLGISVLKALVFVGLLANCFISNVEALVPAEEIQLPSVQGWRISAVRRSGGSVTCSAQKTDENGVAMTLLATTAEYRDGKWFLGVLSPNQHLKQGVQEALARLSLNGNPVVEGKALAVSKTTGNKTTATCVRFDFPAIDAHVENIEAARVVELQVDGLDPLKLESLSPIISAIKKCLKESSNPAFWKDAKDVCN